jgi:hypothetical protein
MPLGSRVDASNWALSARRRAFRIVIGANARAAGAGVKPMLVVGDANRQIPFAHFLSSSFDRSSPWPRVALSERSPGRLESRAVLSMLSL